MPTAVVRHQLSGWPFTVMLSDENSMAGQVLSDLEEVDIEVQVSKNGQPGLSNVVLRGEIRGVALADSPRLYLSLNPAPR
jgi:cytochrome c-type biogenesis protein CcmH